MGTSGTTAEEARVDSASLLRELASESAAAPQQDEPGADEAWQNSLPGSPAARRRTPPWPPRSEEAENAPPDDRARGGRFGFRKGQRR